MSAVPKKETLAAARAKALTSSLLPSLASSLVPITVWAFGNEGGLQAICSSPDDRSSAAEWKLKLLEGAIDVVPLLAMGGAVEPVFVCSSRLAVLQELGPRLVALDDGKLNGQMNSFAVLGPRGVGKSRFLKSLVHVVALVARPTTCVIYVNFAIHGMQEPLKLLQRALSDERSGVELPPALRESDSNEADCMPLLLDFMRESGRRVFLVIDGVEEMYRPSTPEALALKVHRQLRCIGEVDGPRRPILAVVSGSAAVLRPLLYSTPHCDIDRREYPHYMSSSGLSDRKFVPLSLRPIVDVADLRRAVLCVGADDEETRKALERAGHIVPPKRDDFTASTSVDAISQGYTVSDSFLAVVNAHGRGLASWILQACKAAASGNSLVDTKSSHAKRMLGDREEWRASLERLFVAWYSEFLKRGGKFDDIAALVSKPSICEFAIPLGPGEEPRQWYRLMDAGLVHVNDAALPATLHFVHPSDAAFTMKLHFFW